MDDTDTTGWYTPADIARDYIRTFTGRMATPLAPTMGMIHIEDIAHALSHECRFAGHVREFYSVAEHSVRVSWLVPPEFALEALLHDASEAYMKDIPRPIKRSKAFDKYRDAEAVMMGCIFAKFGVGNMTVESSIVKLADLRMCSTEQRDLTNRPEGLPLKPAPLPDVTVMPWSSADARQMFLRRYADLIMEKFGDNNALGYCHACKGVLMLTARGVKPLVGGYWRHVCGQCGGDFGHQMVRADAPNGWHL